MHDFNCAIPVSADMMEYLKYESDRRHIAIEEVYREEMAAEQRACAKLPSREELKILARNSNPDPRYLCPDDDPF